MARLVVLPHHRPPVGELPCAACKALYGSTCCEVKSGDSSFFPMTYSEAERIAATVGESVEDVVSVKQVSQKAKAELSRDAGARVASAVVDGYALYLPKVGKACRYLGPDGCTIPRVKPRICAMFPFTASRPGEWRIGKWCEVEGFCLGQDLSRGNVDEALTIFDTTRRKLDTVARLWRRDLREHPQKMRGFLSGRG